MQKITIAMYKGKGGRDEWCSHRGINLSHILHKVHKWKNIEKAMRISGRKADEELKV